MSVVGLLAAGGSGERLGAERPKAFVVVAGRPMLEWSVDVLRSVCDRVVAAVPAGWELTVDSRQLTDVVVGGSSRSASVRIALTAAPEADAVVVHDAARPLVTRELVSGCLAALAGSDGAIAAAPVTDTIKEAGRDMRVRGTLDRGSLWAIQTPQAFRAEMLRRALDVDDELLAAATDDAALVEAAGGSVSVVEAPATNLKVTTPLDLEVAERLLAARRARAC